MSLLALSGTNSVSGGYEIDNSAAFGGANGIQFNPSSDGNQRTWTMSLWVKRSEIGVETTIFGSQNTVMVLMSTDWFRFTLYNGSTTYYFDTENGGPVYRDTSAWYHFVFQCDTTQGTASDRAKLWVNGASVTNTNSNTIPQNAEFDINDNAKNFNVGYFYAGNEQLDGYLAEVNFTDGVANDADAFGEYDDNSGIWKPKAYAGSYGTNGFYLEFKESAASATGIGKDTSGNGHNFSTGGAYPAQATDTPTNNFCTLNILNALNNGGGNNEYTEGATKGKALQSSEMASGTMAVTQGKWYYECKGVLNSEIMAGWGVPNLWGHHSSNPGYDEYSFAVHNVGRAYYYGNSYIDFSPSVSFDTTDIISVALDADNGFCYWAKNGTWMNGGSPTSGSTGTGGFNYIGGSTGANMEIVDGDFLVPAVRTNYYTNGAILLNFGGYTTISISSAASDADGYGTFEYAPPTGYYALCTKNLEEYG